MFPLAPLVSSKSLIQDGDDIHTCYALLLAEKPLRELEGKPLLLGYWEYIPQTGHRASSDYKRRT